MQRTDIKPGLAVRDTLEPDSLDTYIFRTAADANAPCMECNGVTDLMLVETTEISAQSLGTWCLRHSDLQWLEPIA